MNSRRPHTKSRNGCHQCKRRHPKCNEQYPTCTNCKDYRNNCTYREYSGSKNATTTREQVLASGAFTADKNPSSKVTTKSSSSTDSARTAPTSRDLASIEAMVSPFSSEWPRTIASSPGDSKIYTAMDMQLLHHYSTVVYQTLSTVREQREVWQSSVVNVALRHKFLLQGILALSALHVAHSIPARAPTYLLIAATYQDEALAEFRRLLVDQITSETCRPLFLFSCFLSVYSFALPAVERACGKTHILRNSLYGFIECIQLTRGASELITSWYEILAKDELGVLLRLTWKEPSHETSYLDLFPLAQLYTSCDAQPENGRANPYTGAIEDLHTAFRCSAEPNGSSTQAIALTWPGAVPRGYLELLTDQDPKAMIILAHYAVLLHEHRSYWYFQNWGEYLVERIAAELGGNWEQALAWPKRMVGIA